jgi:hypothetical protein
MVLSLVRIIFPSNESFLELAIDEGTIVSPGHLPLLTLLPLDKALSSQLFKTLQSLVLNYGYKALSGPTLIKLLGASIFFRGNLSPVLAPCHDEISFETVVICVGLVRIHVKETEQDHADDKVDEVQPHVKIGISIDE